MAYLFAETPSAIGEIYGSPNQAVVVKATATSAVTKGQVVIFSEGKVAPATTAGLTGIHGVAIEDIGANASGRICIEGAVSVETTAEAINVGDYVAASGTAGKVQKLAAADIEIGYALTAISVAGGNIIIKLTPSATVVKA